MNHFKELRIKNGFPTQLDLAKVLFVNQTAISQWERGVTTPSPTILLKLSKMYGTTTDYLLGASGNEEKAVPPKGDGRREKFAQLFEGLTQEQQDLVIAAMKGFQGEK